MTWLVDDIVGIRGWYITLLIDNIFVSNPDQHTRHMNPLNYLVMKLISL